MSSLFSQNTLSQADVSANAAFQVKGYEQMLSLRIALQKVLDEGNKFPVRELHAYETNDSDYTDLTNSIQTCVRNVTGLLTAQVPGEGDKGDGRKRRRADSDSGSSSSGDKALSWDEIMAPQQKLQASWEASVNRWHSRLHYGSEKVQSKLRVFNQTLWEQVNEVLADDNKCIQKSRAALGQSQRVDKPAANAPVDQMPAAEDDEGAGSGSDSDNGRNGEDARKRKRSTEQYDMEVYDDRSFYTLLLKAYITSGSSGSGMRADDLAQLRKYRKQKADVDRRASKGRKLRYTVHKKLQNFMFPHEAPEPTLDVERLLQSLFQ